MDRISSRPILYQGCSAKHQTHQQQPPNYCDDIWFSGRTPKHAFIAWLALNHALKTRVFLASKNIITDASCGLCNRDIEDETHLFINCDFSSSIWVKITTKLNIAPVKGSSWHDHLKLFIGCCNQSCKDSLTLARLCFSTFIWAIWNERN